MLNAKEQERYQRQIVLNEIGHAGQMRLKQGKVLCIGSGGLGSPLCLYLAASGIGTLGIIDGDKIALNNLHRQILYRTSECGLQKTVQAKIHLNSLNPYCNIQLHNEFLTEDNALSIIDQYDIVADCSDNFATRYLVNDACCELNKKNVFASVQQFQGYCTVFPGENGPCYRCLFESPPKDYLPNCSEAGVLGTVAGILGTFQANEIIKLIVNIGKPLVNTIFILDALNGSTKFIRLKKSPNCLICSKRYNFKTLERPRLIVENDEHTLLPERFRELTNRQEKFILIDVRDENEYHEGHLENALNIPVNQFSDFISTADKNHKIILYCQSDRRSRIVCDNLLSEGFKNVFFVKGGLNKICYRVRSKP